MLRLVCCALVLLGCACGSKDDSGGDSEDKSAENAATWTDAAKGMMYNSCMEGQSGAVWQRYCFCAVDKISKDISYSDFAKDVVGYGEKMKTNGIPQACVKWAKGE